MVLGLGALAGVVDSVDTAGVVVVAEADSPVVVAAEIAVVGVPVDIAVAVAEDVLGSVGNVMTAAEQVPVERTGVLLVGGLV